MHSTSSLTPIAVDLDVAAPSNLDIDHWAPFAEHCLVGWGVPPFDIRLKMTN